MTREQLIATLERLQDEDAITQEEAALLLDAWDRDGLTEDDLSLTGEDARPDVTDALVLALLIALARFLDGTPRQSSAVSDRLAEMDTAEKQAAYEAARDEREQAFREATAEYKNGDITMREWHARMRDAVMAFGVEAAVIARGGPLLPEERGALQAEVDAQMGFLRRYADTAAVREALADMEGAETAPLSEPQMQNRSSQYAYLGIAVFWTSIAQEQRDGTIARYISQDDGGTCSPCLNADIGGPYLPENVPTPGVVCVANGRCRCTVEFEYAPEIAATL
jgi:hypothetical protein